MANLNHSLCVLCCHQLTDNPPQQTVNDNPTLGKWLSKLKTGKFETKDKPGLSSLPPELCSECLSIMIKVGDKREELDNVEEQVRCLQKQLLRMLRHLSGLVGDYLEEMKGIEGKIRGSEEKRVKIKGEGAADIEHEEVLNNALAFRGQIFAEIQELSQFYPILSSKLTTATDEVEPELEEIEVKIEMEDNLLRTTDFVEDDPPPFSDSNGEPNSPQGYQSEEEIKEKPFQKENEVGNRTRKRQVTASATKNLTQLKAKCPAKNKVKGESPEKRLSKVKKPVKRTFPKNYLPGWITCKRYKLHNAPRGTQRRKHYICQSCPNKIFQRTYGLEQHLRFHEAQCTTDTKKYSCPHCPLSFSLEQLYHFHLCCHEGIIKAACDTCNKSQVAFDLERHLKEDHKILKPIQCPNCFHFSSNRDKFLNHLKYHLGKDALYPCDLCPVTYHTRKELLKHLQKEHQALEPIPCGIGNCTRIFLDKNSQNAHHITHTKRFACLICDKTCASDVILQNHLKTHDEKQWPCITCGRKLVSKEALDKHLKLHENQQLGIKPEAKFQCHLCEKRFAHESSFRKHMDWHNGRIHKCNLCEATFPHQYSWRRHMESHANPNPGKSFVCHVCGSGYKRKQHFRVHLKTHFEEKKFECEYCTKRFMRKEQLKQHLRVHTGEKPYVCEICGKAFNQAGSLWHHKKLIHPQSQVVLESKTTSKAESAEMKAS